MATKELNKVRVSVNNFDGDAITEPITCVLISTKRGRTETAQTYELEQTGPGIFEGQVTAGTYKAVVHGPGYKEYRDNQRLAVEQDKQNTFSIRTDWERREQNTDQIMHNTQTTDQDTTPQSTTGQTAVDCFDVIKDPCGDTSSNTVHTVKIACYYRSERIKTASLKIYRVILKNDNGEVLPIDSICPELGGLQTTLVPEEYTYSEKEQAAVLSLVESTKQHLYIVYAKGCAESIGKAIVKGSKTALLSAQTSKTVRIQLNTQDAKPVGNFTITEKESTVRGEIATYDIQAYNLGYAADYNILATIMQNGKQLAKKTLRLTPDQYNQDTGIAMLQLSKAETYALSQGTVKITLTAIPKVDNTIPTRAVVQQTNNQLAK